MRYNYLTENTCSQMISFDLDGNVVTNIKYGWMRWKSAIHRKDFRRLDGRRD